MVLAVVRLSSAVKRIDLVGEGGAVVATAGTYGMEGVMIAIAVLVKWLVGN